jgi:hypothetical protein
MAVQLSTVRARSTWRRVAVSCVGDGRGRFVAPATTRARARAVEAITHYVYAGDTALHVAATAYRPDIARELLAAGADVGARNRRGATPLRYAADGVPASPAWNPTAQAATIACLVAAGADPNVVDKSGVSPCTAPCEPAARARCAR